MLQTIVRWSLQNRPVVVVLSLMLLAGGIIASYRSRLDAFPEFAPPQVTVQTEASGLSAEEVEQLVTLPLEQSIVGIPGLATIRSRSIQGLSAITVVFRDEVDLFLARQLVGQRIAEIAGLLPATAAPPRMGPMTKTTGRLVVIGFSSNSLSSIDLRDRIQWDVRPRILALPGVALTTLFGGDMRQYQVRVTPDKLLGRGLGINDVIDAGRSATAVRGGGFQDGENQRLVVRIEGQVKSIEQLAKTVIDQSLGSPVILEDVADVVVGAEPKFGDATINGEPGVAMLVYKQFGSDTLEVTKAIENELERLRPNLTRDGIFIQQGLFRQADFIEKAVRNVIESLWVGAILVAIVLTVLLFNIRTAFISLVAIPLSLLSAILTLWFFGISLNTLTLGGLAIAVGEVVDDAIIDVENIYRRLRENATLAVKRNAVEVAIEASLEVRSAVLYATLIVVLVFVPVLCMTGVQGRLFAPLGYAYILAVLASLVTALTLTPALSVMLLTQTRVVREPWVLKLLQNGYEFVLRRVANAPVITFAMVVATLIVTSLGLMRAGGEFLPELRESHLIVHMQSLVGTSLQHNVLSGKKVAEYLNGIQGVRNVCHLAGRAEQGEDTWGVEYGEIEVPLEPNSDVSAIQRRLLDELPERFPGRNFHVFTFLSECIHDSLSGSIAPVLVKVTGQNLVDVDAATNRLTDVIQSIPGSEGVYAEPQEGQPELVVRIRHEDASRYGIRPTEIIDSVHAAYQGVTVAQCYDRNRIIPVVVILDPSIRERSEQIEDLWIRIPRDPSAGLAPSGIDSRWIQLRQVADVFLGDGRFLVTHENGLRMRAITLSTQGRDVESFVRELEQKTQSIKLPDGVVIEISGEHVAKQSAQKELLFTSLGAGIGVVLLLWMALRDMRMLLLVLLNVPFALVGGVAAVYFMGNVINVGSMVGFVTLFGITMRNGIMMVSHWQHLHCVEGDTWSRELIFRGARERLGPVLMTALITGLGLAPIAIGSNQAGREIEGPMAIVILGGLITSTVLNLLVLPCVACFFTTRRLSE